MDSTEDRTQSGKKRTFISDGADSRMQNSGNDDQLDPPQNDDALVQDQSREDNDVSTTPALSLKHKPAVDTPAIRNTSVIRDEFIDDDDPWKVQSHDAMYTTETADIPTEVGSPTGSIRRTLEISFPSSKPKHAF